MSHSISPSSEININREETNRHEGKKKIDKLPRRYFLHIRRLLATIIDACSTVYSRLVICNALYDTTEIRRGSILHANGKRYFI